MVMEARLDAIDRLTRTTAQANTLDDIYDAALEAVASALGASRSSILLFDPDGVVRFKAWRGLSGPYRRATEGHTPWSVDTTQAEPVLISDAQTDETVSSLRSGAPGLSVP